jgi:hypothetical protein
MNKLMKNSRLFALLSKVDDMFSDDALVPLDDSLAKKIEIQGGKAAATNVGCAGNTGCSNNAGCSGNDKCTSNDTCHNNDSCHAT